MGFEDFKKAAQNTKNLAEYNRNIAPDHVKPQAEVKIEANYAKDLINQITYEVPDGMTEEVAMAIAMGAMLDDELLKNSDTSSSAGVSTTVEFRRSYMVMNGLVGDGIRGNEFYFVMPRARELAREAFEKYKNGDRSDVDRYAANVMRVAGDLILGAISTSKDPTTQSFVCQCACTLYDSGYAKEEVPSQLYLDKIRRRVAVQELTNEAVIQTARLAENFPEANSAEREEALLTIMAANTINQTDIFKKQINSQIQSVTEDFFSEELEDQEDPYKEHILFSEKNRANEDMLKNTLFPDEYMLADQERRTAYVEAVKKYIRTTDNFKKLLEADEEYFAENFSSLSNVKLTEEKIYEMVGAENMKLVNQENRSNADHQATILEDYIQHTREKLEAYERKQSEKTEETKAIEEQNASYRKNADAIREILLSCAKETQGLGDKADQAKFYFAAGKTMNLTEAVKSIIKDGRAVYLKHPSREVMMQFTPKNNEDGMISLEQRETTAYQYPGNLPVKNIHTMHANVELARNITLPHEVGSLPGMEKLSFCKRQLVDAAYGIDMVADYHAVIDAIEEAEQYYKGLYAPQDGTYPVFGNGDKEGLQRAFDSVLQAVSEYQNANPFGMVMDNVKEAVHEGLKYVKELQLDDRKLSLKARVSIQETKDLDAMMVGRTYTKEQSELETRKQLGEYLSQLETLTNGKEISENYRNYIDSLKSLVDTTEPYFIPTGGDGYPPITADDKKLIMEKYVKAFGSTESLLGELHAGNPEEISKIRDIVEKTRAFMERDIRTVEDLVADGKTSLPDAIYNGRGQKVVLPQSAELNTLGGQMNSRIAMTYTDADGVEHQGFFTKNYTYHARERFNNVVREVGDKYPKLKGFFDALTKLEIVPGTGNERVFSEVRDLVSSPEWFGFEKGAFDSYLNNEQFDEACEEIEEATLAFAPIVALEETNGLKSGTVVPSRNTALSRMAALLGVPGIVAGSREITFVQDGVEYQGHFMDAAGGVDLSGVREGDPMTLYGEEVYDNGEGLRKLSELQVLDYICGNTDRHLKNYMYNFDTTDPEHPKFTGPVGIDNDLSFGTYVPEPDSKPGTNGVCLNSINAISQSMADTILALQPEMIKLTLRDLGIRDEEMTACVARLNQVKERIQEGLVREWTSDIEIKQGTIHVIPDADFDRLKLKDLAVQTNVGYDHNLFNNLSNVTNIARTEAKNNSAKDLEKEQTAERTPRDITQKEKEFFTKTERVDIYSRETYEAYSKDFKKVYDELSATEGFFHGSKQQYKDMKSALEQLIQAGKEEPDTARYQSMLNNMRDAVQNYIDYKKDDLGSSTSRKRFDLANQLKNLTGSVRKEVFEGLEMQNERDVMAVNRKIKEAVKAEEQPAGPGISEQLRSISDSLREKLAPANERMKEVLEMKKEERVQLERMIKEFPDVEQYIQTLIKVEGNAATDREKTMIDAFQKLYNDKFVKSTIAQQKEGINKGLQGDMLKYAATVQRIAKSLDQMIPNEVQGARAELASKLHAFAGKRHPNSIDTCAFITGLKETMQAHQTELTDSADPVCRQITELVTNHESHFADLKLAETEQYMIDGRRLKAKTFDDYLDNQQELRSELLPKEPQQELKQVEADKSGPMA